MKKRDVLFHPTRKSICERDRDVIFMIQSWQQEMYGPRQPSALSYDVAARGWGAGRGRAVLIGFAETIRACLHGHCLLVVGLLTYKCPQIQKS
ncbi:hypothetical protein EVAR_4724_1 [Eumeta japonica]|uniref:Uncharacterized protein n=1 Tax=Eumeta variegata TaxID=151549 RepID=A0A4C1T1I9_EUMVA|nr:hypothetical protein EVAR_4724_1 [Eumeta japonica]